LPCGSQSGRASQRTHPTVQNPKCAYALMCV
jgi:hypothetical protein